MPVRLRILKGKNGNARAGKTEASTNFSRETFNAVGIRAIKWTVAEMASAAHKTLNPSDQDPRVTDAGP
jgi:hypothetical protein